MSDERYLRTVEREISAPPAVIFALLTDPERHPDIDGSDTVKSVQTSAGPLQLGSTFAMNMRRGFGYTTRNTIVGFEPDRLIAWQTRPTALPLRLLVGGRIWTYELSPTDTGTLVRETWDLRPERNRRLVSSLADDTERGMRQTLESIERLTTQPE